MNNRHIRKKFERKPIKHYIPVLKFNAEIRNVLIKKCIINLLKQCRTENQAVRITNDKKKMTNKNKI